MIKNVAVGALIGFIVGFILPILFPVLLVMEIALYQNTDYDNVLMPHTSISSSKPFVPGGFIVAISMVLGGIGGWITDHIVKSLQRNKAR
jgi:hypothetical protein